MALSVRRILVTDGINPQCAEILRDNGLCVTIAGKLAKPELIKMLETHDTLLVRSATKVTRDVIEACPNLKLIGRAGTGVDNIDVEAATRHGVLVMNTPGGNTLSAAEHTCVLMTALSRNLAAACASLKEGKWDRSKFLGSELYGKTLAVIGLGRIGREVAHRMRSYGMKVIGYDPIISAEAAREFHVEKRELEAIWPDADYITVHTPLIPQTRNLINASTLARCKRGVRVVNVARGGIVCEPDLLAALQSGQCAGAALDVFEHEPPTELSLVQHPAVICTPHLGANTREAQLRVAREIAEQIVDAVNGGPMVGLVNAGNLSRALNDTNRPWIELGQALGAVISKLAHVGSGHPFHLEITLNGEGMEQMKSFLSPAVLVGMMAGMTPNGINLVNAPLVAQEAGVTVSIQTADPDSARRSVAVRTSADSVSHSVTGALQGNMPTLLELDGAEFESGVTFGRNVLFFQCDAAEDSMMSIITVLAAAHAQIMTVMTSSASCRGQVLVVRTQEAVQFTDALHTPHAKFLLQAAF